MGATAVTRASRTEVAPQADRSSSGTVGESALPNGVRVLSETIPGVRSATVGVFVLRGAAHESVDDHGSSHLIEHMVFKGTERREPHEIAVALEGLGGSLDAYTSREHTAYQARVLDEHLPIAVDVLGDLTLAPLFRQEDLELEREVVLEEIAQVDDTPDDLVFELHGDRLWGGHPYGRPILGTEASVSGMEASRLRSLHGDQYIGSNLVVAAAGNVAHDALVELANRHFGSVAPGLAGEDVARPTGTEAGRAEVERSSAQSHVVFGGLGPRHGDQDRHPVAILSSALGAGMSSRLFQRVREELGLCYSVFSYHSFYREAGVVGVYVGTRPATVDAACDAIRQELARVVAEGLPPTELERTKQQMKGQITLSLESTSARLYRLAASALYGDHVPSLDELLGRIDAVTQDDVVRVAQRYFDPEAQLELRLGPN